METGQSRLLWLKCSRKAREPIIHPLTPEPTEKDLQDPGWKPRTWSHHRLWAHACRTTAHPVSARCTPDPRQEDAQDPAPAEVAPAHLSRVTVGSASLSGEQGVSAPGATHDASSGLPSAGLPPNLGS